MKTKVFLLLVVFSLSTHGQCHTLEYDNSRTSSDFGNNFRLRLAPGKFQNTTNWIANRFFSKEYAPKILGYEINSWNYPDALSTSYLSSPKYTKSKLIAGATKSGYIWLENNWMMKNIPKIGVSHKPGLVFLIAHEIMHLHQRKSTDVFRIVLSDTNGEAKRDSIGNLVFKKDSYDNFISGFNKIPEFRVKKIKELFADYGAGIAIYDLLLYEHDEWIVMETDSIIKNTHKWKYDQIVSQIKGFIQEKMTGSESTHGSTDERIEYFLKGINHRRSFVHTKIKSQRLRRVETQGKKGGIFLLLLREGSKIIEKYK